MKDNFFRNKQILTAIGKVVLNEAQGQHAEIDEDAFEKLLNILWCTHFRYIFKKQYFIFK